MYLRNCSVMQCTKVLPVYSYLGNFSLFQELSPHFKSAPNKIRIIQHVEFSTDLIDSTGTVLCTVMFPK